MRNLFQVSIKLIFVSFSIIGILLFNTALEAGQFIKIDEIDDQKFPNIKVFLTVKDLNKNIIRGLNEENIILYEDGYLVNYIRVRNISETNGPSDSEDSLHIVISIDSSKSISAELLNKIKNSANDFLGRSGSQDMIALYRFNDEVILLNGFTNNRADLVKNINEIERHGTKTLLYNALYDSLDRLFRTDSVRKAIIVFTDGKDEGSSIEINDVIDRAKETHIPIYCIAYNPKDNEKPISRMSKLTGGVLYKSDSKNISDIYNTILSTIKNRYAAEYKSMIEPDGKSHSIEAKLKYDNIRDTDRKEITVKKRFPFLNFTLDNQLLLLLFTALLIIILLIIIIFLKNLSKMMKAGAQLQYPSPRISESEPEAEDTDNHEKTSDKTDSDFINDGEKNKTIDLKAWLVERDGAGAGKKIPIEFEETTIGKSSDNNIIIDDRSAAGIHAKIKLIKNSFYIFDMASGKGTFLNDNKLLRPKLLYDWDEIKIGKKVYIFRISNIA